MPRVTVVHRYFDPGNYAAPYVYGIAFDNQSLVWQNRAIRGRMNRRIRGLEIGGGDRRDKVFLERRRLYPHVRKQIDGRLLDVPVRSMRINANAGGVFIGALRGDAGVVVVMRVQPPTPLHRARTEDQSAALVAIERQVVGCGARVGKPCRGLECR